MPVLKIKKLISSAQKNTPLQMNLWLSRVGHPLKHPKVTQSQQTKQLLGGLLTGCTIACMQTGKYHQRKSVSHLFLQLLETRQPTNHSETAVLAYLTQSQQALGGKFTESQLFQVS